MDGVDRDLYNCRFKAGISRGFALAQEANRYLDSTAPWKTIKSDRQDAATSLWVSIAVINCLKTVLFPYIPFSAQKLHEFLGLDGRVEEEQWDFDYAVAAVKPGGALRAPSPLYTKLDPKVAEEEVQRLGMPVA
jgi:methionyl-tRNA synthetase